MCAVGAYAQEMAVSYCLPRTTMQVKVTYKQTVYTAGKYAQWAHELLGIDDVRLRDTVMYTVERAEIYTGAEPDTNRVYTLKPEAGLRMQYLAVDEQGILAGYNTTQMRRSSKTPTLKPGKKERYTPHVPSVLVETYKSDSMYLQAKQIAKQIFHLRDNRIYLLSGDTENMPHDGESMKVVLEEIDRQEKDLVKLFAGRSSEQTLCELYELDPSQAQDSVFAHVGNQAIEARITVRARQLAQLPAPNPKAKRDKNAPQPSQLYYNMPGSAHVVISCGDKVLADKQISVAQLGVAVPLSRDLFDANGPLVEIRIDTRTGSILSITQAPSFTLTPNK